jgi:hypothetical protein
MFDVRCSMFDVRCSMFDVRCSMFDEKITTLLPMKTLHLYDPALCCSSGVCGPSVDPVLVRVQADLEWLKKQGIAVERHNLAQQPADFAANETVKHRLRTSGPDVLPLVLLDGELVAAGFYPTREQFAKLLGLKAGTKEPSETDSACCGSTGCC